MNTPSQLLKLDDIAFLKALVKRYPEAELLAGPAESSPEGNPELNDTALAYQVFGEHVTIDKTAVEAERTFLGLLLFKDVMNGDATRFVNLSQKHFDELHQTTLSIVQSERDIELMLYALTAQDLGKTEQLVHEYRLEFGQDAEDHDKLIHELTERLPARFPGFITLSEENQRLYLEGLSGDLNLGQYVQGECLAANLEKMNGISQKARATRLLTEIYDFAGVTGHVSMDKSMVMNDDNYIAFSAAQASLLEPKTTEEKYNGYIAYRAGLVELFNEPDDLQSNPENVALARIVCLSRAFTVEQGNRVKSAWKALTPQDKQTLTEELAITGTQAGEPKGILMYYAPALIVNHIKRMGTFHAGLYCALSSLASEYRAARTTLKAQGPGVETVNLNALAKQVLAKS